MNTKNNTVIISGGTAGRGFCIFGTLFRSFLYRHDPHHRPSEFVCYSGDTVNHLRFWLWFSN